jgi:monofunctional glycosyltransferase
MAAKRKSKSLATAFKITVLLAALGGGWYYFSLPDPSQLQKTTPEYTALMTQRIEEAKDAGKTLKIRRRFVPLRDITPLLREAVRVSEDASFYDHDGFDFFEMQDALAQSIKEMRAVRGASTISQQLVKNVYLSPSRNPIRKVTEAILTRRLEESVDKNRIMELYLNLIEWGDGCFGIEQAAREYFGESAFSISPAQSVLLAAMLPAPLKVSPKSPNKWLLRRAHRLLKQMKSLGRISDVEYDEAVAALNPV